MGDPPQCDDIAGHPLGASRRLWFYQTLYPAGTTQRLMSRCERNCVLSVSQSVNTLPQPNSELGIWALCPSVFARSVSETIYALTTRL